MAIDLDGLARGIASVKAAGRPIVHEMDASAALTNQVFELLGPHSFNEVGRAARTLAPQATLDRIDGMLQQAVRHQAAARAGFDDAFGAGSWMSETMRAEEAFTNAARRVLADPRLGPDSADTARSLLHSNNFTWGEAKDALQMGRVEKLASSEMSRYVKPFDDEALARAERWREIYQAPAAS